MFHKRFRILARYNEKGLYLFKNVTFLVIFMNPLGIHYFSLILFFKFHARVLRRKCPQWGLSFFTNFFGNRVIA